MLRLTPQVYEPGQWPSARQVQVLGTVLVSQLPGRPSQSASLSQGGIGHTARSGSGQVSSSRLHEHRQLANSSVKLHAGDWPGQSVALAQPGLPHQGCRFAKPFGAAFVLPSGEIMIGTLKPFTWLTS